MVQLQVDASTEGLGAVLILGGQAASYFTVAITAGMRQWLEVPETARVESRFVAALEFLTILLAVRTWRQRVRDTLPGRVQVAVRTDSAAAMGAALKFSSSAPRMNEVAKELCADGAAGMFTFDIIDHVPGLQNCWADTLSHLRVPDELTKLTPASPPEVDAALWTAKSVPPVPQAV